jgi:hypothetical protein
MGHRVSLDVFTTRLFRHRNIVIFHAVFGESFGIKNEAEFFVFSVGWIIDASDSLDSVILRFCE